MGTAPGSLPPAALPFADRAAAGLLLAAAVKADAVASARAFPAERRLVLALPRGGVPVAKKVAAVLSAPLDVIVIRKIGHPRQPELGLGAIAEGGHGPVLDESLLERLRLTRDDLRDVVDAETAELRRRVLVYRGGRPMPSVRGKQVIVVDDGLATGGTARAALRSLRAAGAGSLVLAVPVAARSAVRALAAEADRLVALATPSRFSSVGEWYITFGQLSDADVLALLA